MSSAASEPPRRNDAVADIRRVHRHCGMPAKYFVPLPERALNPVRLPRKIAVLFVSTLKVPPEPSVAEPKKVAVPPPVMTTDPPAWGAGVVMLGIGERADHAGRSSADGDRRLVTIGQSTRANHAVALYEAVVGQRHIVVVEDTAGHCDRPGVVAQPWPKNAVLPLSRRIWPGRPACNGRVVRIRWLSYRVRQPVE